MGGVAFDGGHQVGNEIAPALQCGFNVGPGLEYLFLLHLETVVAAAGEQQRQQEQKSNAVEHHHNDS